VPFVCSTVIPPSCVLLTRGTARRCLTAHASRRPVLSCAVPLPVWAVGRAAVSDHGSVASSHSDMGGGFGAGVGAGAGAGAGDGRLRPRSLSRESASLHVGSALVSSFDLDAAYSTTLKEDLKVWSAASGALLVCLLVCFHTDWVVLRCRCGHRARCLPAECPSQRRHTRVRMLC
jgi:hypothetical protein